jgi:hypothetical protein
MKVLVFRWMLTVLLIPCAGIASYAQGLYWESKESGSKADDASKHYYMPKMFKSVEAGTGGNVTIFRLDKEVLYQINTKEKTYSATTFAEMEKAMKRLSARMDKQMMQMKKQLESMPADQRKKLEEQMGPFMAGEDVKVDVINTGERAMISGFAATKFVVKTNGREMMALWATWDVKEYDSMRKDYEQFMKRSAAMQPVAKGFADAFIKIEGFPVQTEIAGRKETVTKVEKRLTPISEFEVPSGFKLEKKEEFEGLDKQ